MSASPKVFPLLATVAACVVFACGGDDTPAGTTPPPASSGPSDAGPVPNGDTGPAPNSGTFTINAPASTLLRADGTTILDVAIAREGFARAVTVEVVDLAGGVTAQIEPASLGASVKITLAAGPAPAFGARTLKLRATAEGLVREATVQLLVAGKPGDVDTTFAQNGILTDPDDECWSLTSGPDGRLYIGLLVAGAGAGVVRLSADGQPDATFGNAGTKTFSIGATANASSAARAMAVAADGSIFVAGAAAGRACVTKLDASGTKVAAFGTSGDACLPTGTDDAFGRILLLGDGSLLVAGVQNQGGADPDVFVAKFDAGGKPAAFGTNGVALLSRAGTQLLAGLAVDSKQRVVVGATCYDAKAACAFRLTPAGYPDAAFNGGAAAVGSTASAPFGVIASDMVVDSTDTIYVAGTAQNNSQPTGVSAFDASGASLAGFGTSGWVAFGGKYNAEKVFRVGLEGGKLVTLGEGTSPGVGKRLVTSRVDFTTKALDPSYGLGGSTLLPVGGLAIGMVLQPHRAVMLSYLSPGFSLLRVWR